MLYKQLLKYVIYVRFVSMIMFILCLILCLILCKGMEFTAVLSHSLLASLYTTQRLTQQ